MKIKAVIGFVLLNLMAMAVAAQQKDMAQFCARYISSKDKITNITGKANAEDLWVLMLKMSLNPKNLEGLEYIEAEAYRDGGDKAVTKLMVSDFLTYAENDAAIPGNKIGYPKIVTFKEDAVNGTGTFYSNDYNANFGADFYFSKKGMDYSNSKSVNEYKLTGAVYGYKFQQYVREKDLNGEWVNVPKYTRITLTPVTALTVVTSDKFKPMPKTSSVGDVEELKGLGQ